MMSRRLAIATLVALATSACSKLAFVAANVPAAFGSYTRRTDIAYGVGRARSLDVYWPAARLGSAAAPPIVVFFYGGRWESGDKADYRFVGAALASLGIIAVLPNYRHYPDVKMAGFMQDAAQAVAFAAAHSVAWGGDPRRVFLMGHSAGAHIAALLALNPQYLAGVPPIAGVIGLSGPYDFLPLTEDDTRDMFGPPERYEESQPIHFARPGAPPMLLVQGLKDDVVWPKNSINLAAALESKGVPVTLKLYPGLSHTDTVAALSIPARGRAPILEDIGAFVAAPAVPARRQVSPPPSS